MRYDDTDIDHETEAVVTPDGWRLPIHRVRAAHPDPALPPVLCLHGVASTGWTFLGGRGGGLTGALASAGRDVWVAELRGSRGTYHGSRSHHVRVRDKAEIDVPALLRHVKLRTGWDVVDLIGHSLGGVLVYLHAASGASDVRRAVTISSPLRIPEAAIPGALTTRPVRTVAKRLRRVAIGDLTRVFRRSIPLAAMSTHFAPDMTHQSVFEGFLRHGVGDTFGPELADLINWVRAGDPRAMLGGLGAARMPHTPIRFPVRFLVGGADPLTTPDAVHEAFVRLGGEQSDFHLLSSSRGHAGDYRHSDILVGDHVHRDVAPLVIDWLAEREQPGRIIRPEWGSWRPAAATPKVAQLGA